jgi:hypothetical protein
MKIKTLAIAAATLAVGAITSQAQVYSQNIVGYANVSAAANQYVLACNPLTTGNDVLTNVFQGLPGGTILYYWNNSGWSSATYSAAQKHWKAGANIVDNTNLPPGVGFFLYNATAPFTNTFAGTIVANTGGGKATNSITTGFNPVGSVVPYADVVTNGSTINLAVGGGSILQIWDPVAGQYNAFTYSAASHNWKQGSTVTNPPIAVGQGFFISPNVATNWVQTLQ